MSDQTPPQARPSKTMSSRLMTMKFMQRAAASVPSVPQSQAATSDAPPSKRQKVSTTSSSTAAFSSDLQLIQVALTEEEGKREKAIERLAEEKGETNWILSTLNGEGGYGVGGLRFAKAGYSETDPEPWRPAMVGRRSFGKFNRGFEKRQDGAANKSQSSGETDFEASEEDGEKGNGPADTEDVYPPSEEEALRRVNHERHQRKQQRRAEKGELARLADKRRSKEVKLNKLSSISGGGVGGSSKLDMECYSCGAKGHAKKECPQRGKRRNEDWHGGPQRKLNHD